MKRFVLAALAATMLALSIGAAEAKPRPGFNCHYAKIPAEHAVCASYKLAKLDRKLNYWFAKAMQRAHYFDDTHWLKKEQRRWLARRNRCGWNNYCLKAKYRKRIQELRNYATHT